MKRIRNYNVTMQHADGSITTEIIPVFETLDQRQKKTKGACPLLFSYYNSIARRWHHEEI